MYYLRTKPAVNAIQFTVDKTKLQQTVKNGESSATNGTVATNGVATTNGSASDNIEKKMAAMTCSLENKDECLMCGS